MPAPLAKGLIISITILVAAGVAVYENPQVRRWVDDSRRKIVLALHEIGEELGGAASQASQQRRREESRPQDVSSHEDQSAEAMERRRRARQEIFERGRYMEERRRTANGNDEEQTKPSKPVTEPSDLVEGDGSSRQDDRLLTADVAASGITTASDVEQQQHAANLRQRNPTSSADAMAAGSAFSNPFADESSGVESESWHHAVASASHPAIAIDNQDIPPALPPKPAAYRSQSPMLKPSDAHSEAASEPQLLDLTPTTSNFSGPAVHTPTASNSIISESALPHETSTTFPERTLINTGMSLGAVNEWAESQSALQSFHSFPPSSAASSTHTSLNDRSTHLLIPAGDASGQNTPVLIPTSPNMSTASSVSRLSQASHSVALNSFLVSNSTHGNSNDFSMSRTPLGDDISDISDLAGGVSTPSTWTDVGSQVGEEIH